MTTMYRIVKTENTDQLFDGCGQYRYYTDALNDWSKLQQQSVEINRTNDREWILIGASLQHKFFQVFDTEADRDYWFNVFGDNRLKKFSNGVKWFIEYPWYTNSEI